ncbi:FHA domain-containing protein [Leptolyngbya sp. AN03gr2]|uniref:FHA domain-containing protein n=1 Tax=unclassified Leptolyngbya TaxID=2650499 RepID=UPI003D31E15A
MTSHTVSTAFLKPLGATSENTIVLEANETTIGRDPGCQIILANEGGVSRRHAVVYHRGQQFSIADLNSSNGTFVNGQRIQTERVLRTGDQIQFGSQGPQFAFILPVADNPLPATQAYTPKNNVAPTVIRTPAIAQPPIQPPVQPPVQPVQPAYVPETPPSNNSVKWGLIIGSLCVGGIILWTLLGLGARLRTAGSPSSPPSQQPISANPPQSPTNSPQTPTNSRPSQAPTSSQPTQNPPSSQPSDSQTPTFANGVSNAFVCESTTSQPCPADANNITRDTSLGYTVFYSRPLDPPVRFRSTIRFTSPGGEQRQVDLGTDTFQTAARSFTVPLGKPNGGWRPGTYEFVVEAQNSGRRIIQSQRVVIP